MSGNDALKWCLNKVAEIVISESKSEEDEQIRDVMCNCVDALWKTIPINPECEEDREGRKYYYCICEEELKTKDPYCCKCGQAIDWSEEE